MAVACVLLAITLAVTVRDLRRRKVTRWFDTILFALYGLAGCVLFFLMFCSVREATWPNYNAFWANPFMLFPAVAVWFSAAKRALIGYHWINLVVIVLLALAWYWLPQVANPAFFPLMALPALRSANFLMINRRNS